MTPTSRLFLLIAAGLAALVLPYALGASGLVFSALVLIALFAVMSYGLDLIVSDLGEVSLCHPVFFAVGAYATALSSTRLGFSPPATFVLSMISALAMAAFIAFITLRLREFAFSLVTYALSVVAMTVAANWAFLGGSDGITGVPVFEFAGLRLADDRALWPLALLLLTVTLYCVSAFRRSRLGTEALTVHLNARLATMSGIDPQMVRMKTFLISAPITASAGWLYAYQRAYVSVDILTMYFLILSLTAVILVGRRMLLAPLIGTALILVQEKFLSLGAYYDRIILGGVLVLVLATCPQGLFGLANILMQRFRRGRPQASAAAHPSEISQ